MNTAQAICRCLCAAMLLTGVAARAADDPGRISVLEENDGVITHKDRYYTQGLQVSYLSSDLTGHEVWNKVFDAVGWALPTYRDPNGVAQRRFEYIPIAQAEFTPEVLDISTPDPKDRPYAAWLHTTFTLESVRENQAGAAWQDQWKLDLGVVGPWALGRQVQNTWHKLINVEQANGWANQLRNEPTVDVSFERAWRSAKTDTTFLGLDTDTIPYGVVALGNAQTYAGVGAIIRLGPDLPDDFGPSRIYPGIGGSDWFHASPGFDWYVFGGGELRGVARDIFLDGNTFRDSQSVDKKPFVGDIKLGAVALYGDTRLSFTHVFRTREFYGQPKIDQFGSITLSFGL